MKRSPQSIQRLSCLFSTFRNHPVGFGVPARSTDIEYAGVPSFRARLQGSPGAGKPHAGKYRVLTLSRQRGGRGIPSPLPTGPVTDKEVSMSTHKKNKLSPPQLAMIGVIGAALVAGIFAVIVAIIQNSPAPAIAPTETPPLPILTSTFTPNPIPTDTPAPSTLTSTSTPSPILVPANVYWHNIGIAVKQGQQIEFTASGTWFSGIEPWTGPDGDIDKRCGAYPVPCGNLGALVGKVGDNGTPFKIGSFSIQVAPMDGILFLAMNDSTGSCSSDVQGSCYWDNIGSLQVTITVR